MIWNGRDRAVKVCARISASRDPYISVVVVQRPVDSHGITLNTVPYPYLPASWVVP